LIAGLDSRAAEPVKFGDGLDLEPVHCNLAVKLPRLLRSRRTYHHHTIAIPSHKRGFQSSFVDNTVEL
jgi:hypothetical protein